MYLYGEDIFLGTWEGPHVFSQRRRFFGFLRYWIFVVFSLFFDCFSFVFVLKYMLKCWMCCVCGVDCWCLCCDFGASPKVMPHPYKYRGSKKWWKILNKKVMTILLFMRRVVCLFVCLLLKQWRACTDEQWTDEREGGGHTSTRTWGFIWQWRSIFAIMLKGEVMPHPYKYSVAGQKYTLWEVTMYILVFQEPLFNFIDAVRKAKWCDAPSL